VLCISSLFSGDPLICVSDFETVVDIGRFTIQEAAKYFMITKILSDLYIRIDEDVCYSLLLHLGV